MGIEPSAGRGVTIWMSTIYSGEGKQEGREEMRRGGKIRRLQRKKKKGCDSR
jgi:hypothetical protein